ncbi:MAG TPA: lysylphosphatidylglycerol synthase transmembrane domain-containing protein [Nitrosopumilus sp.]|jgi:hypothetical protein|nr:lysylphosphatidylglycerol synthase transmembrane domain-containing protein [Nitrosopumilus sp.]
MSLEKSSVNKGIYAIIIVIFFYAIILLLSDANEIILVFNQIEFERYIAIFSLAVLTLFIYAWKYQIILKKININLNFKDAFLIYTASMSMIITPGSVGMIVSNYLLKKQTKQSISKTMPALIYDRWTDIVALTIIIGILLYWNNFIVSEIIFGIGLVLSGFIFFVFKNSAGLNLLNNILLKTRIFKKMVINTEEFQENARKLTSLKTIISIVSISFLTKLVPMIAVYFVFDLFDLNIDFFTTSQIFLTNQIIGVLSFIPGGMIVTETGLLGLIIQNGTNFTIATMIVLLLRIVTFWFPVIVGFIVLKFVLTKR